MRNNYGAACEILQTFFQRTQCVNINIVGRLIEQQYIGLALECQSQVQTVSFSTGKHTAFLLLVSTCEIKTAQIGASVDFSPGNANELCSSTDGLEYRLVRIDICVLLVHIAYLDGLTDAERTFVSFLGADNHAEKGGLSGSVWTDDAYNAVGW